MSVEQLTQEALALPIALKMKLVEELLDSCENVINESVQTEWITVAKQRKNEIHDGLVEPIPGEQALAQVRRLLSQ